MIKMFTRNLQEIWKVLLRKSSKQSSSKSEIGDISAKTHQTISQSITLNWEDLTCNSKSLRAFKMCQGYPLYPTQDIIRKTFRPSLSFALNLWHKKLSLIFKAINDFLKKIASLLHFPHDIALYTIHVVDLYLNIPHDEAQRALRKSLKSREDKTIPTDSRLQNLLYFVLIYCNLLY